MWLALCETQELHRVCENNYHGCVVLESKKVVTVARGCAVYKIHDHHPTSRIITGSLYWDFERRCSSILTPIKQ